MEPLDIKLLGREYRVACKPEEKEGLLAAVTYLDEKMRDLAGKTNSAGERLA
ncbi:MAG: cell division protein ZapA, partial [Zoogloea sp.]|nr:cell division protein ZapA [Zoogloea sp.]